MILASHLKIGAHWVLWLARGRFCKGLAGSNHLVLVPPYFHPKLALIHPGVHQESLGPRGPVSHRSFPCGSKNHVMRRVEAHVRSHTEMEWECKAWLGACWQTRCMPKGWSCHANDKNDNKHNNLGRHGFGRPPFGPRPST